MSSERKKGTVRRRIPIFSDRVLLEILDVVVFLPFVLVRFRCRRVGQLHRSCSSRHVTYKNGRGSSDFEDSDPRRIESYGEVVDGENPHEPLEKRQKLSPIVWDIAEKEIISSKNGTAQVNSLSPFCPSQQSSHGANGVSSGGADNTESPADFSSILPQGNSSNEGEYVVQSDKEHVQEGKKSRSSRNSAGVDCFCPSSKEDFDSEEKLLVDNMDEDEEHSGSSYVCHPSSNPEDEGLVAMERNTNRIQCCRSVSEFEMIKKINEGTYGIVYKAKDKKIGKSAFEVSSLLVKIPSSKRLLLPMPHHWFKLLLLF
ncbi:hypothetical protein K1719_026614 [Acacia pycnantha]|nr:hypothetical protein K1719_026614 [Acacia pycnantha]